MKYLNAVKCLPKDLLFELQKYVEGQVIYIPKRENERAGWGEKNGQRKVYEQRNNKIINLYSNGMTVKELSRKYNLSEAGIRKIIYNDMQQSG